METNAFEYVPSLQEEEENWCKMIEIRYLTEVDNHERLAELKELQKV